MSINIGPAATDDLRPRITVIGIGGAGGNAIANMIAAEIEGVEFIVANTDAQALSTSPAERRIQLGPDITGGLGAGARPEVGKAAAEETVAETKSTDDAFETKPESALDEGMPEPSVGQEVSSEETTLSAEEGIPAVQDASHVDPKGATLAGGWSPLNKIPAPNLPGSSDKKDDETEG